ncbi:MAG TPA: hypothetical protein VHW24_01140 [Bryobacteraceae bacterium]|nr:hypothetical protein [Bryobacteraceae bacterium]
MSLKTDIERELGVPVRVRAGAPGSLRVLVDGEQVYSKAQGARKAAEIVKLVREKAATG